MKIIQHRRWIETVEYQLHFDSLKNPGCGFWIPADEKGNPINTEHRPHAVAEFEEMKDDPDYGPPKFEIRRWKNVEPRIGLCDCGEEVELEGFTNTCERCGNDYNASGQLLAPREQWGEETGETAADLLCIR